MADSKEETVDGQVICLLVSLALTLHEVCALNLVLTIEAKSVVLIQDLYLRVLLDTSTHHLAGTQIGLAHNHVNFLTEL